VQSKNTTLGLMCRYSSWCWWAQFTLMYFSIYVHFIGQCLSFFKIRVPSFEMSSLSIHSKIRTPPLVWCVGIVLDVDELNLRWCISVFVLTSSGSVWAFSSFEFQVPCIERLSLGIHSKVSKKYSFYFNNSFYTANILF